ncbi:MAG: glycosyl transferase family 2 [Chloroflexi bacterium]|nr:glycosyl transferase family 2 [Chloroflexota bacterium]
MTVPSPESRTGIIIPCHNYGRFLAEALESALGQTLEPHEVIVVDDGSTDDSLAVAHRFAGDSRVRIVAQQNQGATATYNTGVRASTGEYFLILSADDRLDLRYLERTVPVLANNANAGYVYTAYRMFGTRHRVLNALPYSRRRLLLRPYITATALMRRAAFDAAGGFSAAMEGGHEDWELFVAMAEKGWHGVAVPEVLFHYRKHSTTSRNALTFNQWLGVRSRVYRRHRNLYRLPLPGYLALVILNQQWLRLRGAPRTVLGGIGARRCTSGSTRIVVARPSTGAYSVSVLGQLTSEDLSPSVTIVGPYGQSDFGAAAQRAKLPMHGTSMVAALPPSRLVATTVRAIYQRAAIYQAGDSLGLLCGAVAATFTGAMLVYEPQRHSPICRRFLSRTIMSAVLPRVLSPRVDMVISSEAGSNNPTLLAPMCVDRADESDTVGKEQMDTGPAVERERLLQLYRDLIHAS